MNTEFKGAVELIKEFNATQDDYKALERKLSELKASFYSLNK